MIKNLDNLKLEDLTASNYGYSGAFVTKQKDISISIYITTHSECNKICDNKLWSKDWRGNIALTRLDWDYEIQLGHVAHKKHPKTVLNNLIKQYKKALKNLECFK